MTRDQAKEGAEISVFEPAIDELIVVINRLAGLVNTCELSEMELNETEQLKLLCNQYLEALQELNDETD